MNELIKFNFDTQTVSARELHEKLNIGTQYTKWFERMCDYGFLENEDYKAISQKRLTAQGNETTYIDHDISFDMAKQICMIQRTPEGKQCRQYLIDLEKAWNTPEQIFARALKMANEKINNLQIDVDRMKPKEIFADAVATSNTSILVGDLAKILKQNRINIGANRLFEWLRDNGYLIKRKGSDWNSPTQYSMNLGLLEVTERAIDNPDGSVRLTRTTKVTGKGQQYFINKFLNEKLCNN